MDGWINGALGQFVCTVKVELGGDISRRDVLKIFVDYGLEYSYTYCRLEARSKKVALICMQTLQLGRIHCKTSAVFTPIHLDPIEPMSDISHTLDRLSFQNQHWYSYHNCRTILKYLFYALIAFLD